MTYKILILNNTAYGSDRPGQALLDKTKTKICIHFNETLHKDKFPRLKLKMPDALIFIISFCYKLRFRKIKYAGNKKFR